MSELSKYNLKAAANEGRWMKVKSIIDRGEVLTNNGKEIRILLLGRDSNDFIKARGRKRAEELKDARLNKDYSQVTEDERNRHLMAAAVKDWENVPASWVNGGDDDTPVPYSPENAVKLFENMQWLMDDCDEFVGQRKNLLAD